MKHLKTLLFIVLLGLVGETSVHAQGFLSTKSNKAKKHYQEGLSLFRYGDVDGALEYTNKALKKDAQFTEAYWLKSDIYLHKKDWKTQVKVLRQALQNKASSSLQTRLKIGEALYVNGIYDEALEMYRSVVADESTGEKLKSYANGRIEKCEFGIRMKEHPLPHKPINMGEKVNTPNHDYWPSLRGDESKIVTTVLLEEKTTHGKRYQEDFYSSEFHDGEWTQSVPLGKPVNTNQNEGAQCLSPDGNILFFTACNRFEGSGSCDIFISFKQGETWSFPINPGPPLNTERWEGHPSISSDGRTLYFSSERPGGKGARDLWKAHLERKGKRSITFTHVENLGDSINTSLNEISPFIHPDGKTLYFSSDGGHMGMGRNDVFIARMQKDGHWSKPKNLGYPVNTHHDEIGFIVNADATLGYFSTEGIDSLAEDKDIYTVELPQDLRPSPVTYLTGYIYDKETEVPLSANFELYNLEDGTLLQNTFADEDGRFFMMLPSESSYALNVKNEGYLFYSDQFVLADGSSIHEPFVKKIPLTRIHKDQVVVLKNILFDFDSSELMEGSKAELNNLVNLLQQNPEMHIEIGGHTDASGDAAYNKRLSENRAKSVENYLIKHGIKSDRIRALGYGSEKPITKDAMAAENRRTEFKVIAL